jgi:hypothetical protein
MENRPTAMTVENLEFLVTPGKIERLGMFQLCIVDKQVFIYSKIGKRV